MFHSTPISEPLAHLLGLIMGLLGYGLTGLLTHDHGTRLLVGGLASVLTNLAIGAKVNIAMLDVLGVIVARPLSAYAGYRLLGYVANTFLS